MDPAFIAVLPSTFPCTNAGSLSAHAAGDHVRLVRSPSNSRQVSKQFFGSAVGNELLYNGPSRKSRHFSTRPARTNEFQNQPFWCVASSSSENATESDKKKLTPFQVIMNRKQEEIQKVLEVMAAVPEHPVRKVMEAKEQRPVIKKFSRELETFQVIPEIKRRIVAPVIDIQNLKAVYKRAGAKIFSVNTDLEMLIDQNDTGVEDLRTAVEGEGFFGAPCMRRDYIVHPVQIAEALEAGASAVLLMLPVLGAKGIEALLKYADFHGIECVVEIRNEQELQMALELGVQIIGIYITPALVPKNKTQEELLAEAERLTKLVPDGIKTIVGGIETSYEAEQLKEAGVHAVYLWEMTLARGLREAPGSLIAEIVGSSGEDDSPSIILGGDMPIDDGPSGLIL